MRVSIVPAQITTVEDKIAGNLSMQQAVLLGVPVLFGFIIALLLPPPGQFVGYKIAVVAALFVICGALAFRIKGRIIAQWLILFAVYSARPKHYIYDKNTPYLRNNATSQTVAEIKEVNTHPAKKPTLQVGKIAPHEFARLERLAMDARAGMKFEVGKRGELYVRITEVE